jgi:hypothetical protein
VILFNFSVLARPADSISLRQPDPQGLYIWRMMHDQSIGRICLVVNEDYTKMIMEDWLKKEGIKPSFYEMLDESDPVLRAEKINRIGAVFGKPEWYVDNDPRTCAETLKLGMPTMLIASPYLVRPEWSNMKVIKEWNVLVEELDTQALRAAEKTWRE